MPGPTSGRRFRAACELDVRLERADRKLLACIGAYRDADLHPTLKELAARTHLTPEEVDARLERLAKRRLLWIDWSPYHRHREATYPRLRWKRNRYTCQFAGDPLPEHARRFLEGA